MDTTDHQQNFVTTSNSSNNIYLDETKETHHQLQSESTSTTHLLERNVKQIQIKEESTVKKVVKTREIKHFTGFKENPLDPGLSTNMSQQQYVAGSAGNTDEMQRTHDNHLEVDDQPLQQSTTNDLYRTVSQVNDNNQNNPTQPIEMHHQAQHDTNLESNHQDNSNYQNLVSNNSSANQIGLISNQINNPQSNPRPYVQPTQRTNSRNSNIPPSGYEELDYTLGYTSQQPAMGLINDPTTSNYGTTKSALHVHQIPANPPMIVQHDLMTQNNSSYIDPKYGILYGTTGPVAQVPIITNNSGIYGARSVPEPVYAIRQNGNLTYMTQQPMGPDNEVRWRDPELEEVISFLSSPDAMIRTNSVAYLQHLSYGDDHVKQKVRQLGGIPILIDLLNRDTLEVQRNVCGALRNLSYGRKNDDNKRAIRDAQGIQALIKTLVNNPNNEIRELATSVLWNLSSCEDVKWSIMDDALNGIVSVILVPYTDWFKANLSNASQFLPSANETHWSTVIRNATGVIRNISSAGAQARRQLRDCEGLIESLFFIINTAISRNDVENKLVENCVCILRNLSYRCQETQDQDYDKHYYTNNVQGESAHNSMQNSPSSPSSSANLTTSLVGQVSSKVSENLGCFSFGRRSKTKSRSGFSSSKNTSTTSPLEQSSGLSMENRSATLLPPHHPTNLQANGHSSTMVRTSTQLDGFGSSSATLPRSGISNIVNSNMAQPQGKELLWQPNVVKPYLALLSGCSNSETLEAAAGAIQNLSACFWQPSIDIRATVRKERGLPVLVELLRMDRDRVVCVVATALRNLAIDQKNKELIGKYAMPDLLNKLGNDQANQDFPSSDDTIAAVLATLHEVISNNSDFVRSLYESGGLNKLTSIIRNRTKYSPRVQKFAAQVLLDMWKFTELRELYKKGGWKESHFIVRPEMISKNSTFSILSNTIERPMASQQADRSNSIRDLRIPRNTDQLDSTQLQGNINGINVTNPTLIQDVHQAYGAVPMTALNGHMTNPQALYAQVDRQRKRDASHQEMTNMIYIPNE